jgi:hypothetical protein
MPIRENFMPTKNLLRFCSLSFLISSKRNASARRRVVHSPRSLDKSSPERTRRILSFSLALLFVITSTLSLPRTSYACGPFFMSAIFTYQRHPDLPFDAYARGELGVLPPTYPRAYLVAAYRHLAGIGLDAAGQQAFVSVWNERLEYKPFDDPDKWVAVWLEARKSVPDLPKIESISVYREVNRKDEYINYINCTQDAFQFAAKRLQRIAARYGAASDQTKRWATAQDAVFANCHEGQNQIEAPPAGEDAALVAERMYQAASALFYAMRFDEAIKVFDLIARDPNSPYRSEAAYLIARAYIRQATLAPADDKQTRDAAFKQAEAQLRKVLADARAAQYHKSARGLLSYVRLRADTEARLHELARDVLSKNADGALRQNLWDYTYALDTLLGKFDASEERKLSEAPASALTDEVSDWIVTFQAKDAEATAHAISKWQQTHSLAWLVSAISKANKSDAQTPLLLAAADKVPAASPAYAHVNFHAIRLLIALGSADEARRRIDVLLSEQRAHIPPSAVNQFLSARMPLARNAEELLRDAQRTPVAYSSDVEGREIPDDVKEADIIKQYANGGRAYFDADGANVLNSRLPLSILREAATSQTLTTGLRRDVTQAVFVRAALLGNRQIASELAPQVARLMPELKTAMQNYLASANDEEAKYNALYIFLHFPGIEPYVDANLGRSTPVAEIDNFRDNWWCNEALTEKRVNLSPQNDLEKEKARLARAPYPLFLSAEQKAEARKELQQLAALGTAPNYLCRQAIAWAKAYPEDARVPEALHLAVRATRYGCTDEKTGAYSKAAFDVLHKQYPESEWAKKTKYWYK